MPLKQLTGGPEGGLALATGGDNMEKCSSPFLSVPLMLRGGHKGSGRPWEAEQPALGLPAAATKPAATCCQEHPEIGRVQGCPLP